MKDQHYNWKKLVNQYQSSQTDSSDSEYNSQFSYNDGAYYLSQPVITLQALYQDWPSQKYSCYWKNKIMQLTLNQSVQAVFKSAFKPASELIYESVYKSASEPAFKPAEQKKQLQLLTSKQSLLIITESVIFIQFCFSYHASYCHKIFYS